MKPGKKGLARIIAAAGYSWQGFNAAWKHEAAFREELMLALILVPAAFWLGNSKIEIALMTSSLFIVLMAEILNSAIEAVVDRFGSEHHELSGRAKDMGSAAVFLALINVIIIWAIILL